MKPPKINPGKKLQATARRVRAGISGRTAMTAPETEEYDEAEPNMRFSSAFMVVLLLHVTAFGGIWAFDKIKAHRVSPPPSVPSVTAAQTRGEPLVIGQTNPTQSEITPGRPRTAMAERTSLAPVKSETPERAESTGKLLVYTVSKGDNPVTIAHHFGVSYDDLLKLNNIEDPKKLQIGQKLRIPGKRSADQPIKAGSQGHQTAG